MSLILLSPFVLLIILFIIGATVGIAARRARVVRPDHYHWIVRVLCAVLMLAALVAVGVGTWRGTGAALDAPALRVSVPTHAPQPLPSGTKPYDRVDLGPTKLIATVLLVRQLQDQFVPISGESRTLDWPAKGNSELVFQGESAGSSYNLRMNLSEFLRWNPTEQIRASNGVSVEKRGRNWSSGGGMELKLDTLEVEEFGGFRDELHHAPLSVIPVLSNENLRLLVHLTRADRDDPLRQVSVADWLGAEATNLPRDEHNSHSSYGRQLDQGTPPGIRMMTFLGPSAILLLLASVVGSALFPRRWRALGLTGLLTCMVLYAGLLDGVVMQRRERVATDDSQTEALRASALESLHRGTFFHTGKATAKLREIAAAPRTPAAIRAVAAALAAE